MQVAPSVQHEGGLMGQRMNVFVVLELGYRHKILPVILSLVDKEVKVPL